MQDLSSSLWVLSYTVGFITALAIQIRRTATENACGGQRGQMGGAWAGRPGPGRGWPCLALSINSPLACTVAFISNSLIYATAVLLTN